MINTKTIASNVKLLLRMSLPIGNLFIVRTASVSLSMMTSVSEVMSPDVTLVERSVCVMTGTSLFSIVTASPSFWTEKGNRNVELKNMIK